MFFYHFVSSSEPKSQVSYSDHVPSVVHPSVRRLSVNFSFKRPFLQNH